MTYKQELHKKMKVDTANNAYNIYSDEAIEAVFFFFYN